MPPVFSVIIATYNAANYLERALGSVLAQECEDWEILVQDGGSTDGTLDILAQYADLRIRIVSKADTGVYDAWNRAVLRAKGQWCLFLGADDFLADRLVLARCARHLAGLPPEIVFAYGVLAVGSKGTVTAVIDRSRHEVFNTMLQDMGLPFPATFVRAAFLKHHPFDAGYRIAGDYDLAAAHVSLENVARLPVCVSYFELGGLSSNPTHHQLLLRERHRVLRARVQPRLAELTHALEQVLPCARQEHGVE